MLIDCCASGGRRNDLEVLRRAVPLWQSDYGVSQTATQGNNYGAALWMPFHGRAARITTGQTWPISFGPTWRPVTAMSPDPADDKIDWSLLNRS